jgi:hypothetical protein
MDGACSSNGREGKPIQNSAENLKGSLDKYTHRKGVKVKLCLCLTYAIKAYGLLDV